MSLYTRKGDDGKTGILSEKRIWKSSLRIEAIGQIDELNAILGLAASYGSKKERRSIQAVQNQLFIVGANLASPGEKLWHTDENVLNQLEGPKEWFRFARAVCIRAIAVMQALGEYEPFLEKLEQKLNQLSK